MKDNITKKVETEFNEYSLTDYGLSRMSEISYAISILIKQAVPEATIQKVSSCYFEDSYETTCRFSVGKDRYTALMNADAGIYYCEKVVPM